MADIHRAAEEWGRGRAGMVVMVATLAKYS